MLILHLQSRTNIKATLYFCHVFARMNLVYFAGNSRSAVQSQKGVTAAAFWFCRAWRPSYLVDLAVCAELVKVGVEFREHLHDVHGLRVPGDHCEPHDVAEQNGDVLEFLCRHRKIQVTI